MSVAVEGNTSWH